MRMSGRSEGTVHQNEWLTLAEVQRVLDLGRTKTYELVAAGEIPAVKIGRVLRVNREELDRWLETKRVVDPAER
jgi:excisionase family DNA binding protein